MPAHFTPGLIRPTCPDPQHAGGRVWLGGFYGRNGFHERPRWWCVPPASNDQPAWDQHRFSEPLRRRHSTDAEHGKQCEVCEHVPRPDQGPVTGRGFSYTITEAARALMSAGEGLTYRTTSYKTRRHARPLRDEGDDEISDHPQLVMNYLDAFGDEIYSRHAEIEWPEVLILDALPQHEKDTMAGGAKKKGGRRAFSILAAYGIRNGKGKLWRLGVYGAEDVYEWERFLRTMPGQVRWVVCDQAGAIAKAARAVWPDVTIYNCEWHISKAGLRWVRPTQLGDRYAEIVKLVKASTQGPDELGALGDALASLPEVPPSLARWYDRQRRKLPELWAKRQPGMPRGSGPLEDRLDRLNGMLGGRRRFRFRNLGRLERLLGLMLLELNRTADERAYSRIIRDALASNGGSVRGAVQRWRALADPRGTGSSVRELTKRAEQRIARQKALEEHRKINRRIERAWRAEQRKGANATPAGGLINPPVRNR